MKRADDRQRLGEWPDDLGRWGRRLCEIRLGRETIEARVADSAEAREVFVGVFVDDDLNAFVTASDIVAMSVSTGYWVVAAPLVDSERLIEVTVCSRVVAAFDYGDAWLCLFDRTREGDGRCVAVTAIGDDVRRKTVTLST